MHDSQVAIPLATITAGQVTSLYDLMDSAYDVAAIKRFSRDLNHVPIIDINPRATPGLKQELADGQASCAVLDIAWRNRFVAVNAVRPNGSMAD